jgi:hypothetical protein
MSAQTGVSLNFKESGNAEGCFLFCKFNYFEKSTQVMIQPVYRHNVGLNARHLTLSEKSSSTTKIY